LGLRLNRGVVDEVGQATASPPGRRRLGAGPVEAPDGLPRRSDVIAVGAVLGRPHDVDCV